MRRPAPRVPFKPRGLTLRSTGAAQAEAAFSLWFEGIRAQARANLESGDVVRIAWTNRFKIPRYPSFAAYTPEEALLEIWEQHYFENPDSLELKGIVKRKNPQTGATYYVTGDPVIDALEEAFGRNEVPDLSVLTPASRGQDIFRAPVFQHSEGSLAGHTVSAEMGLQGVQETPDGAKMTAGGAKVHHTDFSSDAWLKAHLDEDLAAKALGEGKDG